MAHHLPTPAPAFTQTGDFFSLPRAEVERSPSVLDRSVASWADEVLRREALCTTIIELGQQLKVPQPTQAVACVYLHRFFSRHSFREYADTDIVCGACMLLAAKVEESRRKVHQIVEQLRLVRDKNALPLSPEAPVRWRGTNTRASLCRAQDR